MPLRYRCRDHDCLDRLPICSLLVHFRASVKTIASRAIPMLQLNTLPLSCGTSTSCMPSNNLQPSLMSPSLCRTLGRCEAVQVHPAFRSGGRTCAGAARHSKGEERGKTGTSLTPARVRAVYMFLTLDLADLRCGRLTMQSLEQEALAAFRKALRIEPQDTYVLASMGAVKYHLGDNRVRASRKTVTLVSRVILMSLFKRWCHCA